MVRSHMPLLLSRDWGTFCYQKEPTDNPYPHMWKMKIHPWMLAVV